MASGSSLFCSLHRSPLFFVHLSNCIWRYFEQLYLIFNGPFHGNIKPGGYLFVFCNYFFLDIILSFVYCKVKIATDVPCPSEFLCPTLFLTRISGERLLLGAPLSSHARFLFFITCRLALYSSDLPPCLFDSENWSFGALIELKSSRAHG